MIKVQGSHICNELSVTFKHFFLCNCLYYIHSLQESTHIDGVVHSHLCFGLRHAVGRDPTGHNV